LAAVVDAAFETVRASAEASGVTLTVDVDRKLPPVAGDAARLRQVVWNLVSNAIKFTERGGRVGVRVAQANGTVELVVRDTGRGISAETLPHVFERFQQGEASGSRATGGLGLAIVRYLGERHGGTVEAEGGGDGQGATFTVRLPVGLEASGTPEVSTATRAEEERQSGRGTLHDIGILIVEDDSDTVQLRKRSSPPPAPRCGPRAPWRKRATCSRSIRWTS
jgi:anti-sigma regulatory factor (Ser/Thr protein kinase)